MSNNNSEAKILNLAYLLNLMRKITMNKDINRATGSINPPNPLPPPQRFRMHSKHTAYKISMIVPAYNAGETLSKSVESILDQTLDQNLIEIIIINDGSTDNTYTVAQSYATNHPNVLALHQQNTGVSAARNHGLDYATGTYIGFLDSDDTLAPETLKYAVEYFDEHSDEIDLVTYPMYIHTPSKTKHHVREQILNQTGIFDLSNLENAFALITNVNVIVKNSPKLPRFNTSLRVHEDEEFNMRVLLTNQTVGFSKHGGYHYEQLPTSTIHTRMNPLYHFEDNIAFWESLFSAYPNHAPLYLQASFVNECVWKLKSNVLWPYHYKPAQLAIARTRIGELLERIDPEVILSAPRCNEYTQEYLLNLRPSSKLHLTFEQSSYTLIDGTTKLWEHDFIAGEIQRTIITPDTITIRGVLKSTLFRYCDIAEMNVTSNETIYCVPLRESGHSYYTSHTKTNVFKQFSLSLPTSTDQTITFSIETAHTKLPIHMRFFRRAALDTNNNIYTAIQNGCKLSYDDSAHQLHLQTQPHTLDALRAYQANTHQVQNARKGRIKMRNFFITTLPICQKPSWLYYDKDGMLRNDAFIQFLHDIKKTDGVIRYYIASKSRVKKLCVDYPQFAHNILTWNSIKHRMHHLHARAIITSSLTQSDWCPFSQADMRSMADLISYQLIYIPTDTCLACKPWEMYSDRAWVDYIVSSSAFETQLLTQTYSYLKGQLIESGQPAFSVLSSAPSVTRKVLIAPSWRSYLVNNTNPKHHDALPDVFISSHYWLGYQALLTDKGLIDTLRSTHTSLDISLDARMSDYSSMFSAHENDVIHLVTEPNSSEYQLLITDFCELVSEFVYLQRDIAYFLPDNLEFRAGLHEFRTLEMPYSEGFGPTFTHAVDLVAYLKDYVQGDSCASSEKYKQRKRNFFIDYDQNQCERLYTTLREKLE